ncbi:MAG: alpha-L-fucosidase [Bryobacteraceae bacterium]
MRLPAMFLFAFLAAAPAQTPNADDVVWENAVHKFDAARAALVRQVDTGAQAGPFRPNWDSLKHYQLPTWYQDAKFGIFLHWGVYSVPAFGNEWYPRNMYKQGSEEFAHHVATYGPQTKFGYKDFVPRFKAEHFDAKAWADLFRKAGAKYVVPVAEHHDGFAMYNSDLSDWCAAKMGPHRDTTGELAQAVRAAGLHFGVSSHRAEHYFFLNTGREFDSDVRDPQFAAFYGPAHIGVTDKNQLHWQGGHPDPAYLDDWIARVAEMVNKYQPEIVWFDWWIETKEFEPYLQRLAAFYYNDAARRGSTAAINYKLEAFPVGTAVLDIERGQSDQIQPRFWQTDTSVSIKSWGYIDNDTFRSPESLVQQLVDIVSKNGALLLNVGPKPDGTIPEQAQNVLLAMGRWLSTNGEAIYGTRPWKISGEGPTKVVGGSFHDTATKPYTSQDIRFTTRAGLLYAIALASPQDGKIKIQSLARGSQVMPSEIAGVQLLGSRDKLKWTRDNDGLNIEMPTARSGEFAWAFKITPAGLK